MNIMIAAICMLVLGGEFDGTEANLRGFRSLSLEQFGLDVRQTSPQVSFPLDGKPLQSNPVMPFQLLTVNIPVLALPLSAPPPFQRSDTLLTFPTITTLPFQSGQNFSHSI
jgi:hypothetical protein